MYQVPRGQTPQPTQVQMPSHRGGTHDQQRSADKRRKNDRTPVVTANGELQWGLGDEAVLSCLVFGLGMIYLWRLAEL